MQPTANVSGLAALAPDYSAGQCNLYAFRRTLATYEATVRSLATEPVSGVLLVDLPEVLEKLGPVVQLLLPAEARLTH